MSTVHARKGLSTIDRESHGDKYTETTAVTHCGVSGLHPSDSTRSPGAVTCLSCLHVMLTRVGVKDTKLTDRPTPESDEITMSHDGSHWWHKRQCSGPGACPCFSAGQSAGHAQASG